MAWLPVVRGTFFSVQYNLHADDDGGLAGAAEEANLPDKANVPGNRKTAAAPRAKEPSLSVDLRPCRDGFHAPILLALPYRYGPFLRPVLAPTHIM